MNATSQSSQPHHHHYPFSWRWTWTALCVLLVFHFLPGTAVQFFQLSGTMYAQLGIKYGEALWILCGLALLTGLVGYISNGRVVETALASGVYMMFLSRMVPSGILLNTTLARGGPVLFLVLSFVVGGMGAYIGSMIHIHRLIQEQRARTTP